MNFQFICILLVLLHQNYIFNCQEICGEQRNVAINFYGSSDEITASNGPSLNNAVGPRGQPGKRGPRGAQGVKGSEVRCFNSVINYIID